MKYPSDQQQDRKDALKELMNQLDDSTVYNAVDEFKQSIGTSANTGTINTGGIYGPYHDPYATNSLWHSTHTHTHSINTYSVRNSFSKAHFAQCIMGGNLKPFDLMIEIEKSHTAEAFHDAFMYARELGITDKGMFDEFVLNRKYHSLYVACPEYQTVESTLELVVETKSYNFVSFLRPDIREDAELKREINVLKLKGLFD